MGVHGDRRLHAELVEHHAGGLAADTGQGLEGVAVQRDLAAVLVQQDVRQSNDVLGLGAIEADGADVGFQPLHAEGGHLGGRVRIPEQPLGGLVDRLVGGLGRERHRHHQSERVLILQLGARLVLGGLEALEDLLDARLLGGVQALPGRRAGDGLRFGRGLGSGGGHGATMAGFEPLLNGFACTRLREWTPICIWMPY